MDNCHKIRKKKIEWPRKDSIAKWFIGRLITRVSFWQIFAPWQQKKVTFEISKVFLRICCKIRHILRQNCQKSSHFDAAVMEVASTKREFEKILLSCLTSSQFGSFILWMTASPLDKIGKKNPLPITWYQVPGKRTKKKANYIFTSITFWFNCTTENFSEPYPTHSISLYQYSCCGYNRPQVDVITDMILLRTVTWISVTAEGSC